MVTLENEKNKREKIYLNQMELFIEEMTKFIKDRNANKSTKEMLIKKGIKILNRNIKSSIYSHLENSLSNFKDDEVDILSDDDITKKKVQNNNRIINKSKSSKTQSDKQNTIDVNLNKSKKQNARNDLFSQSVETVPKGLSALLESKKKMDLFEIKEYNKK